RVAAAVPGDLRRMTVDGAPRSRPGRNPSGSPAGRPDEADSAQARADAPDSSTGAPSGAEPPQDRQVRRGRAARSGRGPLAGHEARSGHEPLAGHKPHGGREARSRRWSFRRRWPTSLAPVVLVAALLVSLVVVPVVELVRIAAEAGFAGVGDALNAPGAGTAIAHTVEIAVLVTAASVIGATALAVAVERRTGRARTALRLLIASPLLIPEFVLGFAWSQAYGPAGIGDRLAKIRLPGLIGP